MTTEQAKIDLVNLIFADRNEKDLENEEIIHLLLQSKVAKNTSAEEEKRLSLVTAPPMHCQNLQAAGRLF